MIRTWLKTAATGALLATILSAPAPASAQKPGKGKKEAEKEEESKLDVEKLRKQLSSGKPAEVTAALGAIESAGEAKGAALVEDFLRRGGPPPLVIRAIDVCAALKQTSSSAAVAPYTRHRDAKIRREATKALLRTKGPDAVTALRRVLRSTDAMVRGIAASGLGELAAKEALPDLFDAFDHRVGEAATSIGQLCDPANCRKFLDRLGRFPFDVMVGGLDQILFRSPEQLTDDFKIEIVGRLRELGTKEAGRYLADVAERWPDDWSKRVKQALDQAAKQTGGG